MIMTGNAQEIVSYLMEQQAIKPDCKYDLKEHKEKRSLDSNSYFHVLCDKLRQKLGISMAACKNHLIADYGQIQYIDEQPMIYKTNAPQEYMMELETIHTKLVKVTEENDKEVFFYRVYRGSHTYNSAEMSKLISGTVEECKALGIETLTPLELARMNELWGTRYDKKNSN